MREKLRSLQRSEEKILFFNENNEITLVVAVDAVTNEIKSLVCRWFHWQYLTAREEWECKKSGKKDFKMAAFVIESSTIFVDLSQTNK